MQVRVFKACEGAKPQALADFQLLNRGHVTCHWSPTERTMDAISFLVNVHPAVNLSALHICFPLGVFLLLCDPHSVGLEYFCNVTYPFKTMKNYFCEAVQVRGYKVNPTQTSSYHPSEVGRATSNTSQKTNSRWRDWAGIAQPWHGWQVLGHVVKPPVVWLWVRLFHVVGLRLRRSIAAPRVSLIVSFVLIIIITTTTITTISPTMTNIQLVLCREVPWTGLKLYLVFLFNHNSNFVW